MSSIPEAPRPIPFREVQSLIKIILDGYYNQYGIEIDSNQITYNFIPARTDTRIGFEIDTSINGDFFKVRMYAESFVILPNIKPFRVEELFNTDSQQGVQVFVSISELPISLFPNLSDTTNPVLASQASLFGIELEDLTGFIETESGDIFQLEKFTGPS